MVFSKHKTTHGLVTKSIFVQIFFALFEEKIRNSSDQLYISRISGWISGIRPDIRLTNLVSGRIPDIKKSWIIRPDIRPA
jgi:hypothetical protein